MQEKRNIRLLILLVLLMAATGATLFFQKGDNRVIVDPSIFKVENLDKIDGIVLESPRGKIRLQYDKSGWKVNDRFDADRQLITVLFATLEQALPKRPVAANQRAAVEARLDSTGVSVSLYEGTLMRKSFRSGGDGKNKEAWFQLNKSTEAYVMTIPGYRVQVSQIFELDENAWRDKRVFDFNWRNFKNLSAEFPGESAANFGIVMKENYFTLSNVDQADTAKVNNYLDDLSLLRADQIVSPGASARYDSLAKSAPLNIIEITDIAGRKYRLELFQPVRGDVQALGRAKDNDLLLFDREKIFRIYKKKGWFKPVAH